MPKGTGTAKAYEVNIGGTSTLLYKFKDLVASSKCMSVANALEKLKNSEIATIRTSDRTALDKAWNEYAN